MRNPSLRKESRRLILLSKQRVSIHKCTQHKEPQLTPELDDLVSITKLNSRQTMKDRSVSIFKSIKPMEKQQHMRSTASHQGQLDSFLKQILQTQEETVQYKHIIKERLLQLIMEDQSLKDQITELMELNQYQKQKQIKKEMARKSHFIHSQSEKRNRYAHLCIRKTVNYTFKPILKYPKEVLKFDEIISEKKKHLQKIEGNQAQLQGKLSDQINFMKEVQSNVNHLKSQFAGYQQRIKDLFCLKKMQRSQATHECTSKVAKDIKMQEQRISQLNRISQCAKLHYEKEYLNNIGHEFKTQLIHLICILHDHLNPTYLIEDEQRVEFFVKNIIITYESLLYPLMQAHRDKDAHLNQIKVEIERYNELRDERKAILQRLKREFSTIDLKSIAIFKKYNQEYEDKDRQEKEKEKEKDRQEKQEQQEKQDDSQGEDEDRADRRIQIRKTKLNNQLNLSKQTCTPNTLSPNYSYAKSLQNQMSVSTLVSFNSSCRAKSKSKLPDIQQKGKARSVIKYETTYKTELQRDMAQLKECFERTATMFKRSVVLGSCAAQ